MIIKMKLIPVGFLFWFLGGFSMLGATSVLFAEQQADESKGILWEENFQKPFEPQSMMGVDLLWNGKRVQLADKERKTGSSHLVFKLPLSEEYRYLQLNLESVEGAGYRSFAVKMSGTEGEVGGGDKPGLYTFDLLGAYPQLKGKSMDLMFFIAGGRTEENPAPPGPYFLFDWMRVIKEPEEGIVVSLADANHIEVGSRLHIRAWSKAGTKDVTVEFNSNYKPAQFNAEPYIQLKSKDPNHRLWEADVVVTKDFIFEGKEGVPQELKMGSVGVKATVVGGEHETLYTSVPYPVELK